MDSGTKQINDAVFRFGAFELRTETGQLFKNGVRIKLQIKPLQILKVLLARPGQLVTREELCSELWPAGTFVDFESGLNTATNRLRVALQDSADGPRYIETLPRLGYRFICPVILPAPAQSGMEIGNGHAVSETEKPLVALQPVANEAAKPGRNWPSAVYRVGSFVAFAFLFATGVVFMRNTAHVSRTPPTFHQLNFRAGLVEAGRFLPGAKQAAYTIMEADSRKQTLLVSLDGSNSRTLAGAAGVLTGVSQADDLAMIDSAASTPVGSSKLVRVSAYGRPVSVLAEDLRSADWSPDGRELALVRTSGTESQVEFPAGHIIYRSPGQLDNLRVSPQADAVAFLEHPVRDDDEGYPVMVDRGGHPQMLTNLWSSTDGLAWSPRGREIWFTAAKDGIARTLYAVTRDGALRHVSNTPSFMRLLDISPAGKILIALDEMNTTMTAQLANETTEHDMSNFDSSHLDDISADGQLILFTEAGNGGGRRYSAFTFNRRAKKAVRFASGRAFALSPDKKSALTIDPIDRKSITVTNLASGASRKIHGGGFEYQWARFFPDGQRVLVGGAYPEAPMQLAIQPFDGGKLAPINGAPYLDQVQLSPDGRRVAGRIGDKVSVVGLETGMRRTLRVESVSVPVAWSRDGNDVFLLLFDRQPSRVVKVDWRTGSMGTWKMLASGHTDSNTITSAVAAPAVNAYAYSSNYNLSRLYVVDGWS
jgi:DNA-binding winged helix-turn-helix (wHTH) protein